MTSDECKLVGKTLQGLYPNATDVQVKLFITDYFPRFDYRRALSVVKTHAVSHEFFNAPQLLEGLRADEERNSVRHRERDRRTIVEWARKEYGETVSGFNNAQVLIHHFSTCREAVNEISDNIDKKSIDEAYRVMKSFAVTAFEQIGYTDAQIKEAIRDFCFTSANEPAAVTV